MKVRHKERERDIETKGQGYLERERKKDREAKGLRKRKKKNKQRERDRKIKRVTKPYGKRENCTFLSVYPQICNNNLSRSNFVIWRDMLILNSPVRKNIAKPETLYKIFY